MNQEAEVQRNRRFGGKYYDYVWDESNLRCLWDFYRMWLIYLKFRTEVMTET